MNVVARALAAVVVAGALAGGSGASPPPHYVYRDVAFVTLVGHGSVTTLPRGIRCPRTCRYVYVRGTHLRFFEQPAPGWRFAGFSSRFCNGQPTHCVFDLVSPHDCVGGACPLGAYGVRAVFLRR